MALVDKTILVIGGASGIGFEAAASAARRGAQVTITSRSLDKSRAAAEAIQAQGFPAAADAFDAADEQGAQAFFERLSPVDHVVSMAGGFMGGGFLNAPVAAIRNAIEEKFFANLLISRLAAPRLREGGSLVLTAGSGGRPYGASGATVGNEAISTLARRLAVELAPGRRANAVAPTWTPTPLWSRLPRDEVDATERSFAALIPLKRTARVEEVAAAYIFLMENGFVTGQTLAVDGGVTLVS